MYESLNPVRESVFLFVTLLLNNFSEIKLSL